MSAIFVFGSNTQGRHGAGAAKYARDHYGAVYGCARGPQGSSYAIVTKELRPGYPKVQLTDVATEVQRFMHYAREHDQCEFLVTPIGTGLAGFTESQIKPLFANAPLNCFFSWREV
jgi:hypothetical protein